jgi:hypothetical protein
MKFTGLLLRVRETPGMGALAVAALCAGFIALSAAPVVLSWEPTPNAFFTKHPELQMPGGVLLAAVLIALIFTIARLDGEAKPWKVVRYIGFVLLAALLTDIHVHTVDAFHLDWQWEQYNGVLHHTYVAPDQYRFLSQGTLWWMFLSNGSFVFSYLAYRFFFTFLLCHLIYKFARLCLDPVWSTGVVLLYALFYPLSIRYYYGNLCDPTSHAAMLAALIFCQRREFWPALCSVALGTFIKETILIVAPCWLLLGSASGLRFEKRDLLRVTALVAVGLAVFFACRLPFDFRYDFQTLNRTNQLMIWSNLGLPQGLAFSTVPVFQRYLHPVLFLFMWLPLVIWRRAALPVPLFRTALYLTAAFYLTNLCFGWNYESRNFVPGLIVLLVCTVVILKSFVPAPAEAQPFRRPDV